MFPDLTSQVLLAGALICVGAIMVLVLQDTLRSRRERRLAGQFCPEPRSRLDEKAHRIARLLSGERGGVITASSHGEVPSQELQTSRDVAAGLHIICQVVPEVGLHEANIMLLAKLREVTGANDFRCLCDQLATLMSNEDPRYEELAVGLETGGLSWNQLLSELRAMPMSSTR